MPSRTHKANLFIMLIMLSVLLIMGQVIFFFIHYSLASLLDSLARSTLATSLYHPLRAIVWLPVACYVLLQLLGYGLVVAWVWFSSQEIAALILLNTKQTYGLGIFLWIVSWIFIFGLNSYFFPNSFFAFVPNSLLIIAAFICFYSALMAVSNFILQPKHPWLGSFLVLIALVMMGVEVHDFYLTNIPQVQNNKANIILIGIDSLRPDAISVKTTPHLAAFLQKTFVFNEAYTPLARTYPSWITILSGKYPKHNNARMNLSKESLVLQNELLSQRLRNAGYYTMYGTDEPRFTDIGLEYGFDKVIGPKGGAAEFLIGTTADFPIINLISQLAISRFIFPYNYANRAIDVSYRTNTFTNLIKNALHDRKVNQPLFLSVHLCLSHWPYTWSQQNKNLLLDQQYKKSLLEVDKQFATLLSMLKQAALLDSSILVVFSDHGVTLGLPHDRIVDAATYHGGRDELGFISAYKIRGSSDYTINTSYGQGTDVLSVKQYQILLALQKNQRPLSLPPQLAATIDIAPTILDLLNLPPLQTADGIALTNIKQRDFYLETADTFADMESDKIFITKLVKEAINAYELDPLTGYLYINPIANDVIIKNKERAVIHNNWLLAYYPPQTKFVLEKKTKTISVMMPKVFPAYYVLANLTTDAWTIGFNNDFAKQAPLDQLLKSFNNFYGEELNQQTIALTKTFNQIKVNEYYIG